MTFKERYLQEGKTIGNYVDAGIDKVNSSKPMEYAAPISGAISGGVIGSMFDNEGLDLGTGVGAAIGGLLMHNMQRRASDKSY